MRGPLDVGRICRIATGIEQNGERLYRALSEAFASQEDLKELFARLADEELAHANDFKRLAGAESECPADPDGGFSVLDAYARIFSRSRLSDELAMIGEGIGRAVDFAIRREMDSIFFYSEAGAGAPGPLGAILARILEEERRHFREMNELRSRLSED